MFTFIDFLVRGFVVVGTISLSAPFPNEEEGLGHLKQLTVSLTAINQFAAGKTEPCGTGKTETIDDKELFRFRLFVIEPD